MKANQVHHILVIAKLKASVLKRGTNPVQSNLAILI